MGDTCLQYGVSYLLNGESSLVNGGQLSKANFDINGTPYVLIGLIRFWFYLRDVWVHSKLATVSLIKVRVNCNKSASIRMKCLSNEIWKHPINQLKKTIIHTLCNHAYRKDIPARQAMVARYLASPLGTINGAGSRRYCGWWAGWWASHGWTGGRISPDAPTSPLIQSLIVTA